MQRKRIRLNPYGMSKSAREVAKNLGILRLKAQGKFKGRTTDVVINWGNGKGDVGNARQINPLYAVALAANKLYSLDRLQSLGVTIPKYYKELITPPEDTMLVARTTLTGHSGDGIVIGTRRELYDNGVVARLYTEYIPKVAEYRVIVCNGVVVDVKSKRKRNTPEGKDVLEYNEHVWNLKGNYVYTRNKGTYSTRLACVAVDAIKALELDFGAVDVIADAETNLYVLEVNTAFGLEGSTTELFCNELKELLC